MDKVLRHSVTLEQDTWNEPAVELAINTTVKCAKEIVVFCHYWPTWLWSTLRVWTLTGVLNSLALSVTTITTLTHLSFLIHRYLLEYNTHTQSQFTKLHLAARANLGPIHRQPTQDRKTEYKKSSNTNAVWGSDSHPICK